MPLYSSLTIRQPQSLMFWVFHSTIRPIRHLNGTGALAHAPHGTPSHSNTVAASGIHAVFYKRAVAERKSSTCLCISCMHLQTCVHVPHLRMHAMPRLATRADGAPSELVK